MKDMLSSPPAALVFFLGLAWGLYRLGGVLAARGEAHPGKHLPYACGEDMLPSQARLAYHAFFRLALMFAVLHLATLVVSTLPADGAARLAGAAYLAGIAVCVLVLTKREV
ncbi:MAG TPA: hypothetical protein VMY80_00740 [Anaerolineae bacterium]|nr:hypothetical protein [Anaerolineae bacterium]